MNPSWGSRQSDPVKTMRRFPPEEAEEECWRFFRGAQDKYIPGSAEAAKNKGVILEFLVVNLDQEYKKLQGHVKVWEKAPARTPWGTLSMYFRDPDGNLVDFYELPNAKLSSPENKEKYQN
jgi:catechol 2,3-dioxygenase-like lactoylglutathione lyase family enzyme